MSEPFDIKSGVKQGCVLAPTLFSIFFSMVLKHAFGTSTEGVYLHTRSDGRLFNLPRLRAKTKIREVLIRDLLFADDAAVTSHTEQDLQCLMDRLSQACKDFVSPSVWKRPMWWATTWTIHLSSPLTTISWTLSASSPTLGPPSAKIYPSMLKSTVALGRPRLHLADLRHSSGRIPS